ASRAPRCFEWAIGASRLSTGPYRNRSWRLPRGSPRIRFRWSKAGLADALPRAMRLKCKRNVPTAPEVRYLGDLAAQRALAAKGWAFGIASPNSDQRTHLRTQVPYPLGIARSRLCFVPYPIINAAFTHRIAGASHVGSPSLRPFRRSSALRREGQATAMVAGPSRSVALILSPPAAEPHL